MNFRWQVAIIFLLVWTSTSTVKGTEAPLPGGPLDTRVYLFRGIVGYWPHAEGMAAEMSGRGYCPHIYCSRDVPRLTSALISEKEQGASGPIHLIGYSYGASAAVRMARDLMARGITVDRMVLIECYDYPEIPANVRYCVNFYESRRLDRLTLFRGTPARAIDSTATELIDIDVACTPEWQDVRSNNHFNMADDPRVQGFAAQQFPDLTVPASTNPPDVDFESVFRPLASAPAVTPPVNVPMAMPMVRGPAGYGSPNTAYRAAQPYPVPRSSPYASYRTPVSR